jgi:flagellar basal-body rod protein FlgB
MTHPLGSITVATVSLALEAAARRQEAMAANIANAGVDGYLPQRVAFETQLADARASLQEKGSVQSSDLARVAIDVEPVEDASGAPARVQLDVEVAEMARNAVQYQALAQGLSRHLALLAAAAGDGRR